MDEHVALSVAGPASGAGQPLVVRLDDQRALDPSLVGAKAANLARAAAAGLHAVPGEVLTTAATVALGTGADPDAVVLGERVTDALDAMWVRVSDRGRHELAVRSSSTVEDLGTSSMAGRFRSVIGVGDPSALVAAVRTVLASAAQAASADGVAPKPMAVLVQPVIHPVCGGVLFGVDPVSGDRSRIVVEVSRQGPEAVVGGDVSGALATLTRRGRVVDADEDALAMLPRRTRRRLARLAGKTTAHFAHPQDVEWAIDDESSLWLLQTRPVTATGNGARPTGPLLGPGPFGETFPLPLRALERDLWQDPVGEAVGEVLVSLGLVSRSRIRGRPPVRSVDGWVVCDLTMVGLAERRRGWRSFAPLPAYRHLRAAWRTGALRGTLPAEARALGQRTGRELAAIVSLVELGDAQLVALLRRSRRALVSLHAHQMLCAILLPDERGPSLAASATALLRDGRVAGLDDAAIIARHPMTLGLVPPRIGGLPLPRTIDAAPAHQSDVLAATEIDQLVTRDALRTWCRVVQELTARVASELERRLVEAGEPPGDVISRLTLAELEAAMADRRHLPGDLAARRATPDAAPVPHQFRLGEGGEVVPPARTERGRLGGRGAGGGRVTGPVVQDVDGDVPPGAVLVVRSLDPRLAPIIGRLGGLVAETGSVLSHLAILAREHHVATVVGVPDACRRFPPGSALAIDGSTGEVRATTRRGEIT